MKLKTSTELFLGLQEQQHMVDSLGDKGFKRMIKSIATSYGVVKTVSDEAFTSLKIIASGANQLTIRQGLAIDSNIEGIEVSQDVFNILTVPSDNVSRFVIIKYAPTVIEQGTVNIQADGSIFGVSTQFTKRLRGVPNFPSKITFPNSPNNTAEYTVLSIQNDTVGALNIGQGQLVPENGQKYSVVGTFTPFVTIQDEDKFPFITDSYSLELRTSNTVNPGLEFVLAEVKNNGTILSVFDRRMTNLFNVNELDQEVVSQLNPIIGVEQIMYQNTKNAKDTNLMKVGWGVFSISGQWGVDNNLQQISISSLTGGKWNEPSDLVDGQLNGWKAIFEQTGEVVTINSSSLIGAQIVLTVDYLSTYPTTGTLTIIPNADLVEISIKNVTNPTANVIISYSADSRFAIIPIQAGITSVVGFRHILSSKSISPFNNLGSGSYLNEQSFNELGVLTTPVTTNYADGLISPILNNINLGSLLIRVIELEKKNAVFALGSAMVLWQRPASEIPEGWSEVEEQRGRAAMGNKSGDPDFGVIGALGGSSTKTLTVSNLPEHTHTQTRMANGAGTIFNYDSVGDDAHAGYEEVETESVGSGQAFSILDPFRVVMFIEYIG